VAVSGGGLDDESDRVGGRIPFTLEGLTNWGGMDMAVVRRAERVMEPLQGTRLPPRWGRRAMNNDAAGLSFQGFTSSERWGHKASTRPREPATAAVTPAQRLAEVYASSSRPPDVFETAIELPFRLFLSPAQDATWVTSAPRVRRAAQLPEAADAFRELWTARLTGQDETAGVRAVWSPDFRPEVLLSTKAPGAPPTGSYAPWALPRSYGLRRTPDQPLERFRTGLEAYDRPVWEDISTASLRKAAADRRARRRLGTGCSFRRSIAAKWGRVQRLVVQASHTATKARATDRARRVMSRRFPSISHGFT